MSTTKPCAAANCDCENLLIPKLGNVKKWTDMECNHPFGAHQVIVLPKSQKYWASARDVITLDEEAEEEENVRALERS